MTDAVFKEAYYGPRLQTTTTIHDSGVGNTSVSSVHSVKYLFHQKPKSVSGPRFVGTFFRRPMPWSMVYRHLDTNYIGAVQYRHGGDKSVRISGRLPITHSLPSYSFPTKLVAKAELEALLKLKDEKVNVGVSLGERKQVAGMFQDNLLRVASAYRSARKGNFKQAARQLGLGWKDVPNRWLELQYGWKPLLSDIHSAVEALNERDRNFPTRTWLHVKGKSVDLVTKDTVAGTAFNGVTTRSYDRHHHEARVRFDYKPNPEMGLNRTLDQWGISNPLQIAWELTPFSFVVDWAIPIGDYLAAMGASRPYDFVSGSQSRFSTTTRKSHLRADPKLLVSASGEAQAIEKVFYRYVYGSFPFPSARALLASSHPSQQTIATRVANALSILSSAVR